MYECQIIADSAGPNGIRLTSLLITLPRIVLPELNTHRVFSRNSASSRAIPFHRQVERLKADPFIPEEWGRNKRGMQAGEPVDPEDARMAEAMWRDAMEEAIVHAEWIAETIGVHKQLANRLLEPFLPHTVLITATEWTNFFRLRCHPDAQPQIRRAAEAMRTAMRDSTPATLPGGAWHLPFVDEAEVADLGLRRAIAVSVGRCARLSYLTHDGQRDPEADVALANRLLMSGHMSPFEHVAQAIPGAVWDALLEAQSEANDALAAKCVPSLGMADPNTLLYSGNLRGWRQLRKCLHGEAEFVEGAADRHTLDAAIGRVTDGW